MASPPPIIADDYNAADAARKRFEGKPKFTLFSSHSAAKRRKKSQEYDDVTLATNSLSLDSPAVISLNNFSSLALNSEGDEDQYGWAVVFENQRGMTVFSIPYYSRLSLLPTDPYAFTVPSTSQSRSHQPNVTLDQYPLPDGNWRWVSKSWMIDMRSDSGEVQYDGFEYNWVFQSKHWRPKVGRFNAGGWVRRRKWIRLMVRPGRQRKEVEALVEGEHSAPASGSSAPGSRVASLLPPSVLTHGTRTPDDTPLGIDEVWIGEDAEENWIRCKMVLKRFPSDGTKLELWARWLGLPAATNPRQPRKQWTEDEHLPPPRPPSPSPEQPQPQIEHPVSRVADTIERYGQDILQSFVFPASRAHFLQLLSDANIAEQVEGALGLHWSHSDVEFYSYAVTGASKP